MNKDSNITAQAMRQDVLNRLDASRKAILELSDDELESIAGGVGKVPNNKGGEYAGIITQTGTGSDLNPGYEIRPKGTGKPREVDLAYHISKVTNMYSPGAGRGE